MVEQRFSNEFTLTQKRDTHAKGNGISKLIKPNQSWALRVIFPHAYEWLYGWNLSFSLYWHRQHWQHDHSLDQCTQPSERRDSWCCFYWIVINPLIYFTFRSAVFSQITKVWIYETCFKYFLFEHMYKAKDNFNKVNIFPEYIQFLT